MKVLLLSFAIIVAAWVYWPAAFGLAAFGLFIALLTNAMARPVTPGVFVVSAVMALIVLAGAASMTGYGSGPPNTQ